MKLLCNYTDYEKTIKLTEFLNDNTLYCDNVIFHCFWFGELNEKHLYSILSCYYFNIYNNLKNKIILWLQNNTPNNYNKEIYKYAEIKEFKLIDEIINTNFMNNYKIISKTILSYYSDLVRYILLYNYGGVWFDLDVLFLRSFDPLFNEYKNNICVYQWENENYPNGAIYISLEKNSNVMKNNIIYILNLNKGWGFQEALLTYDSLLELLVLPCSWFDPSFIQNPYNLSTCDLFKHTHKIYNFDNFFKNSFTYHWHNKWNDIIEDNSIIIQLIKIIKSNLENKI